MSKDEKEFLNKYIKKIQQGQGIDKNKKNKNVEPKLINESVGKQTPNSEPNPNPVPTPNPIPNPNNVPAPGPIPNPNNVPAPGPVPTPNPITNPNPVSAPGPVPTPNPITNPNPILEPKYTPLICKDSSLGLDNVGATCYMNATLQCLAHIKIISEHIINYKRNGKLEDNGKFKLSRVYADVLEGIWFPKENQKSYSPNNFKNILGKMNSLFAPTAANDAKDLLIYLIEQMHNELNKSKEKNMILIMPQNMDPTNQQVVLGCFANEFMKKYNSIFSAYCYGSNISITKCFGCGICKYSCQCFSFIIFPLLEAKRYCVSSGRLPQLMYNQYILNIEDCFIYNQKIEFFNGENQMYCNICRQLKDASMCTCIYTAPLVLILVLNRGRGNADFKEKFIFWETIDLTNYVQFKQPDNRYYLSGVITHLGESGESGHFIAFCRMSENSKWYLYNDSIVMESNFNEINNRGIPYILFYQKIIMK